MQEVGVWIHNFVIRKLRNPISKSRVQEVEKAIR